MDMANKFFKEISEVTEGIVKEELEGLMNSVLKSFEEKAQEIRVNACHKVILEFIKIIDATCTGEELVVRMKLNMERRSK